MRISLFLRFYSISFYIFLDKGYAYDALNQVKEEDHA